MKVALITGCSSRIGAATARHFAAQGWGVAATMRHPEKNTELSGLANIKLIALDVTDKASIAKAVADAREAFGRIAVLVNNTG